MSIQSTVDKLRELKMTTMADNYLAQSQDPSMREMSFDDRFGILVDLEFSSKQHSRFKRLVQAAEFDQPQANVADINFECGRKLDRELINRLATCEYIRNQANIFITGSTGTGKTYLACALGMEACKQYYSTKYVRLPDLLLDLRLARENNTAKKVLKKYTSPRLLILDEWLLIKCQPESLYDLMELIHHRTKESSTIFCSQFKVEGWYEQLGGGSSPLVDAILDRIVHSAYRIAIVPIDKAKDISRRKIYG